VKSILLHTAATFTVQLGEDALKVATFASLAVGIAQRLQLKVEFRLFHHPV